MTGCVRRRDLVVSLAVAAAAPPLAGLAQQPGPPVVGFIAGGTPETTAPLAAAFRQGLAEAGFEEGRNVMMEYRWASGHYDRLPALAADLVAHKVNLIGVSTTAAALAVKVVTASIPVVFVIIGDPVRLGLVASLSRPGGNITGVTHLDVELAPKLLEILHEAVPTATAVGLLVNPTGPNADAYADRLGAAARQLRLELHVLKASTANQIEEAFARLPVLGVGALVIEGDPFFTSNRRSLADLALRYRLPSIYRVRVYPDAGGLMSYGGDNLADYQQAGVYAGRVLKGEKPADLAVQQTTKFELVINMKTAKALGLTVPQSLLVRADEVIE
jgi:putative tryptophan/tyrosine transport system substrate-binding protein